ncbi:MAG TPA: hypothetical protein VFV67_06015 [Actinophytocola sp.]|uniref:hypothetical protein n=1 Tax=Actinophytocola sp. TaxID=1872138 RepID=UPI002DB88FA0|nr:hypothetical protein [Actinophytocola sp.]HEU5470190.1 hypothetical protein [Actinophytocola sp.]
MIVGHATAGHNLLLHDGQVVVLPNDALPAPAEPELTGMTAPDPLSPAGRILLYATAVSAGAVSLPWTADLLLNHAFTVISAAPWFSRAAAIDVLELGRPDLLARCGLNRTEIIWLTLIHAARRDDPAAVVDAAAALPPDRYRRKIAVLAAFTGRIEHLPGAAEKLSGALRAFAPSDPLAAALRRRLGTTDTNPAQRLDDLALISTRLCAPRQIIQLTGLVSAVHADPDALALLGPRGRLAVTHGGGHTPGKDCGPVAVDTAPLAVLDDLIDRGTLKAETLSGTTRRTPERIYLLGRLAPEQLTGEQLDSLGHRDEAIRRTLATGQTQLSDEDRAAPMGRHVTALDLILRRRHTAVSADDVLPAHRQAAERLVRMLRGSDDGQDPATLLDEALLSDRSTWLPLIGLFGSDRLHTNDPGSAERCSEFYEWLALVAAREHLFLADWAAGVAAARRCLDLATAEPIRDEAQNLLACGLHHLGDHAGALRELESAIEGEYSVALLANIGVVAARLDPERAAGHLARIVREAPTAAMRVNAARRALDMWRSDATNVWQGEEGAQLQLPTVLREPLRAVVTERIDIDDFRAIAEAMALFDPVWLRAPGSLAGSPHRNSLEARYFVARAEDGLLPVVEMFGTVKAWDTAPAWLGDARDKLVDDTIEFLIDHINDPDNAAGVIAKALVEQVRGLAPRARVILALLAVATLTYHLSEQDLEISDLIIELFNTHERKIPALEPDEGKVPANLAELCVRRIALNLQQARGNELESMREPYNTALTVLDRVPRGTPPWFQARAQVAEFVAACQRTRTQLRPWLRRLADADVRETVMDFLERCHEVELRADRVLQN